MQRGKELGIHSRITHAGANPDQELGSVSPPIYQSSTFRFATAQEGARRFAGEETGFIYTRLGNPTVAALESAVADLEGGAGALATASGMAAVNCIYLALLEAGSHLVGTDALYGSSRRIIETEYSRFGVTYDFVDTSRPEKVAEAVQDHTRLVFLESPANPTLKLTDIAACADIAHRSGALVVVDNTFMSPVLQNPLALGADIVIHSLTKYINGHTDVVGGIIVFKTRELLERVRPVFIQSGGCMDPHQAWLILRGLRTLG
ncbi:MAG: PLP-dependent transferase, partial [Candidatus Neomarinimicrobiota bacterium]